MKDNIEFPKDTDMKAIQDGYISISQVDINLNPGGSDNNNNIVNQLTEYLNK